MFSFIPSGSWLITALAVVLVVRLAATILVWCAAATVALTTRDDKRAERALKIFRIMSPPRSRR